MPGVGVISNPRARLNKVYPKLKNQLTFIVGRGGEVASTGSLDDAERAVEEFKRYDIDMVAISGGDGTAHRTIEVMLKVYGKDPLPPILLLPSGTQNMVPGSFGIRHNSIATLLLTLARYRHNVPLKCLKRNVLKVNEHYSFMFALGVASRFLEVHYRGEHSPKAAAKLLGSLAIDGLRHGTVAVKMFAPMISEVRQDDGPWRSMRLTAIFCSFIEELALRFVCFPRAGWDKNLFEVLLITATPAQVAKAIPGLWIGTLKPLPGFERALARSLELKLQAPEPYTLDGEIYEPTDRFSISAGPELRFIVPGLRLRRFDPRLRVEEVGPWDLRYLV